MVDPRAAFAMGRSTESFSASVGSVMQFDLRRLHKECRNGFLTIRCRSLFDPLHCVSCRVS